MMGQNKNFKQFHLNYSVIKKKENGETLEQCKSSYKNTIFEMGILIWNSQSPQNYYVFVEI